MKTRVLSDDQVLELHARLTQDLCDGSKRITIEKLKMSIEEHRCVYSMNNQSVNGFATVWQSKYSKNYYQLGLLWVDDKFRKNGFGQILLKRVIHCAPSGSTLFLITHSAWVCKIMKSLDWTKQHDWTESHYRHVCSRNDLRQAEDLRTELYWCIRPSH